MAWKQKKQANKTCFLVRKKGLEPPRREAPDPKSGAATNYATSASLFPLFGTAKVAIEIKTPNYI